MAIKVATVGVAVVAIIAAIIMGPTAFLGGDVDISGSDNNLTVDGVAMPTQIKTSGTLQNFIGGGLRMKWGFKVYVVGIYSDPKVMTSLKKKYSGFEAKDSNLSDLATDFAKSKPARTVLLRFQRSVAASDISDALGEALKPKVGAASDEFQKFILDMVGSDRLEKGSDIYITCKGETLSASLTGGNDSSSIRIKGLCPAVFEVYLGDKAVSPQAKKGFAEGVATLMASE
ncbi:chalcone isomerase domain-containing protein [Skeletonema marinoi]|uniref:Chalcone isomerase domain-containing protein n=1 Tax=Skeletonema marinoi TaxID=267567 RepID=A0AAD8YNU7_9STRA|nr:chalcone isomerase domain-containing protein [Skeletonema marinoi]